MLRHLLVLNFATPPYENHKRWITFKVPMLEPFSVVLPESTRIDLLTAEGILLHERRQIAALAAWRDHVYRRSREGQALPEFRAYSCPVEIPPTLKTRIFDLELYAYKILMASPKGSHVNILGLFLNAQHVPPDYALLRITSATKKVLIDRSNTTYEAVVIESCEVLDPLHAHEGMPFEKNVAHKLFQSAFGDKVLADSLQAPLLGAPKVGNGKGGIGLGAALDRSDFILGLRKVMHDMLPIELQQVPPVGKEQRVPTAWAHIGAVSTTKVTPSYHTLQLLSPESMQAIARQEALRISTQHEHSYAATAFVGSRKDIYRDLANNFFRCDITAIDLGQAHADTRALQRLRQDITEEVRTSIACAHLIQPSINATDPEKHQLLQKFHSDMTVHLERLQYQASRQSLPMIHAAAALRNAHRIAQALARARGDSVATYDDLRTARVMINTHLETFAGYGGGAAKEYLKGISHSDKWDEVRSTLQNGRATTREIWQEV